MIPILENRKWKVVKSENILKMGTWLSVRQETVELQSGAPLKAYSVVVGSFALKANAEGEVQRLINKGYNARLVYTAENNMYRVVASSFDTKPEAAQSRDQLAAQYQGAWLLYAK